MSDYPMLISNKLHSFRNFMVQRLRIYCLEDIQNCPEYPVLLSSGKINHVLSD